MSDAIYLDYNSTTPVKESVAEAMKPFLEGGIRSIFGNPSSSHAFGAAAAAAIKKARGQVAALLGPNCNPEEVYFSGSASENINTILKGLIMETWKSFKQSNTQIHVITSAVEHVAVLESLKWCKSMFGIDITYVKPNKKGIVEPQDVAKEVRSNTLLVSIMHANNETGAVNDLAAISKLCRRMANSQAAGERPYPLYIHTDAAQSPGKIPCPVYELGVDYLNIAGHKLYAPKGVSALWVRPGVPVPVMVHGSGQERGARSGTENVPYLVGLGEACVESERARERGHPLEVERLRSALALAIKAIAQHHNLETYALGPLDEWYRNAQVSWDGGEMTPEMCLNWLDQNPTGEGKEGRWTVLPNTLAISFESISSHAIVKHLRQKVAISTGAACHGSCGSLAFTPSHVLAAMDVPNQISMGQLRLSLGHWSTKEHILAAHDIVQAALLARDEQADQP